MSKTPTSDEKLVLLEATLHTAASLAEELDKAALAQTLLKLRDDVRAERGRKI
ncbi:hypothetical protein [Acuticoccus sp.]|uniref:hypothetical protein n=1 Tax=Acuticoccus sp. TaxID=1904378 RepID=UPI003B52814B